jgi:Cdc6-like AAA superfamily ATPase
MNEEQQLELRAALQRSFSPGAPVNTQDLFAGRVSQLGAVLEACQTRGRHAILYGERGVGKTSLANIVQVLASTFKIGSVKVNCDSEDEFGSIWRKVFRAVRFQQEKKQPGFERLPETQVVSFEALLPEKASPDDVQRILVAIGQPYIIVIDELDRVRSQSTTRRLADTIKTLSDNSINATLVLVGVADSVTDLIAEHQSIERALVQVQMPRMSTPELSEIVDKGLQQSRMSIEPASRDRIVALSQGLPHYTHSLALYAGLSAIDDGRSAIAERDVDTAVRQAVKNAQQSVLQLYHRATSSPRRENLYGKVLLAAAMAAVDQLGYSPRRTFGSRCAGCLAGGTKYQRSRNTLTTSVS